MLAELCKEMVENDSFSMYNRFDSPGGWRLQNGGNPTVICKGRYTVYLRKVWKAALLVSGAILLTGCETTKEEEWTPQAAAAISLDEEGHVTEYLSEKLEQSYYSFDELNSMLNGEVAAYNSGHGEGKVAVTSAAQENGEVHLVITYASGEDYAQFNNVEFYYGSMINAQLEGYLFDVAYKTVEDGVVHGSEVSGSEVLKNMADMVLVVSAPLEVHVPGNVTFTSVNANVLSKSTVLAVGDTENGDGTASGVKLSAKERADANRVYIVFEE